MIDNDFIERKTKGVVFTPLYIAEYICKLTFENTIINKNTRVIDPSCGEGVFLFVCAKYIANKLNISIAEAINKHVYGIDINPDYITCAKNKLAKIGCFGANIVVADGLKLNWNELFETQFTHVMGNPPYITASYMDNNDLIYMKENFEVCKKGKGNSFYAFIEKSMDMLTDSGTLGFIIPNTWITSSGGSEFRKWLHKKNYLSKAINFSSNLLFAPVRTYTSIIVLQNKGLSPLTQLPTHWSAGETDNTIQYAYVDKFEKLDNIILENITNPDVLNGVFLSDNKLSFIKRCEQHPYKIKNALISGLATLKDDVFIQSEEFFDSINIEKEILRDISKIPELMKKGKTSYKKAIFPYQKNSLGKFEIISEKEMGEKFPNCYKYLLDNKPALDNRDKGKVNPVAWYAYGRGQGINNAVEQRLLYPAYSMKPRFIVDSGETLFINGFGIKRSIAPYPIEVIMKILHSKYFAEYVNIMSGGIAGGYKCYSKKAIGNFSLPELNNDQITFLLKEKDKEKIDGFLEHIYKVKTKEC